MAPLFMPNHVKLVGACYPPSSTLLTSPVNSQELSRLAYYAANRPAKISKVGAELEKRIRAELRKAHAGNLRSRASILISLSILQAVAIETRRDIALLSPYLLSSVNAILSTLSLDLEVFAQAATVFCAWTTYTDGHVIGVDQKATNDYKSALRHFADLAKYEVSNGDQEAQNRTRMVGLAVLNEIVTSEALYNASNEFSEQVSAILTPLVVIILQTDVSVLSEQATHVKDATTQAVGDFRARPTLDRRAASIHIHIDGESGPSKKDVVTSCLRVVCSMLEHSNGWQLGHCMRSAFLTIAKLKAWSRRDQCCWLASVACEWTQYQHRYVVPTRLVERLAGVTSGDASAADIAAASDTLLAMVTAVLTTPAPLVNLSTSDIMHNLIALVLARAAESGVKEDDQRLKDIAACIAALGTHVYYSDQIQDLASELISRLVVVETTGVALAPGTGPRSLVIRTLLGGLLGLMQAAVSPGGPKSTQDPKAVRRTRIRPDTWNDTVSLLCDADFAVRADYARVLTFYLTREMFGPTESEPLQAGHSKNNIASRTLNAMHAYLFVLATAPSLNITYTGKNNSGATYTNDISENPNEATLSDGLTIDTKPSTQRDRASRRSMSMPANRKMSVIQTALEKFPSTISDATQATASDYSHILMVMEALIAALPVQSVLIGVPMVLALDSAVDGSTSVSSQRRSTVKEVVARIWLTIAKKWSCDDLQKLAQNALSQIPSGTSIPKVQTANEILGAPQQPVPISTEIVNGTSYSKKSIAVAIEPALTALIGNQSLQTSSGFGEAALKKQLTVAWTPDSALKDAIEQPTTTYHRKGDHNAPFKISKITEGLSNIDNTSLHSLAKSGKDVGVSDLRDALEGRSITGPYTNGTARTISASSLEANTAANGAEPRLTKRKSMSRKRPISTAVEVRDVLSSLGIASSPVKGKNDVPPLPKSS